MLLHSLLTVGVVVKSLSICNGSSSQGYKSQKLQHFDLFECYFQLRAFPQQETPFIMQVGVLRSAQLRQVNAVL